MRGSACGRRWSVSSTAGAGRAFRPGRSGGVQIVARSQGVLNGEAALARAAWDEARAIFERELEAHETVEALEGLSWAAWWVEDVPTVLDARERAYRLSRPQGGMRRAAMLAIWLANDHLVLRGELAIANG